MNSRWQAVPRFEDPRLLRGWDGYVDDTTLSRMVFGHVLLLPTARAAAIAPPKTPD